MLTGQGNNTVTADGGANFLLNGNGRYNANVYGALNVVLTGLGAANINMYGNNNLALAGDGGNTLRTYGLGVMTGIGNLVVSGAGNDPSTDQLHRNITPEQLIDR